MELKKRGVFAGTVLIATGWLSVLGWMVFTPLFKQMEPASTEAAQEAQLLQEKRRESQQVVRAHIVEEMGTQFDVSITDEDAAKLDCMPITHGRFQGVRQCFSSHASLNGVVTQLEGGFSSKVQEYGTYTDSEGAVYVLEALPGAESFSLVKR